MKWRVQLPHPKSNIDSWTQLGFGAGTALKREILKCNLLFIAWHFWPFISQNINNGASGYYGTTTVPTEWPNFTLYSPWVRIVSSAKRQAISKRYFEDLCQGFSREELFHSLEGALVMSMFEMRVTFWTGYCWYSELRSVFHVRSSQEVMSMERREGGREGGREREREREKQRNVFSAQKCSHK